MKAFDQTAAGPQGRWATVKEALSQPDVWRSWTDPLLIHADEVASWLSSREYDEVWLCGAGTSAFIGDTLVAYLNTPPRPPRCRSIPTTDLVSCPRNFLRSDAKILVVSFGRSGNSSETVGTLDLLDRHLPQADRLSFTCNADSALGSRKAPGPGEQRVIVMPPDSNDSGFAMTSSYSTMLLSALACLDRHPPLPLRDALDRLSAAAEVVLGASMRLLVNAPQPPSRAVFLGCGPLTGSARESALKVLELTAGRVATAWDSTLGFRHGPKAVVDEGTRVHVFVSSNEPTRRYDLDAADEIRQQFGERSVIKLGAFQDGIDLHVPPVGNDAWTSVLYVLAAQIQAIGWSDALSINVDNPFAGRNLTRVVEGVRLYPLEREW